MLRSKSRLVALRWDHCVYEERYAGTWCSPYARRSGLPSRCWGWMHKPGFEERSGALRHIKKCRFTWNVTGPSYSCCATAPASVRSSALSAVSSVVEATSSRFSTLIHWEPLSSLLVVSWSVDWTKDNSDGRCSFPPWMASDGYELDCRRNGGQLTPLPSARVCDRTVIFSKFGVSSR